MVQPIVSRPRALLMGDSITAQYGRDATSDLRRRGFDPVVRAYPGVGLLDRGPRIDALRTIKADLASTHPDVVVAEFSGNYAVVEPPLPGVALASPTFYADWARAVDEITVSATRRGA